MDGLQGGVRVRACFLEVVRCIGLCQYPIGREQMAGQGMVRGEGGRTQRSCVRAGYVGAAVTGMFAIQKEERSLRGSSGMAECLYDVIPQGVQICQGGQICRKLRDDLQGFTGGSG
jgi:hypothetical protein